MQQILTKAKILLTNNLHKIVIIKLNKNPIFLPINKCNSNNNKLIKHSNNNNYIPEFKNKIADSKEVEEIIKFKKIT